MKEICYTYALPGMYEAFTNYISVDEDASDENIEQDIADDISLYLSWYVV